MAGGKETPRQKMVGMMYLVLTALLALNVSNTIIDKFVFLNESLVRANNDNEERNAQILKSIIKTVDETGNRESDLKIVEAAKHLREFTVEDMAKLEEMKKEMVEITGGYVEGFKPDYNGDAKNLVGKTDYSKVGHHMMPVQEGGKGGGKVLKDLLNGYVSSVRELLQKHGADEDVLKYYHDIAVDAKDDPIYNKDPNQQGKNFSDLAFYDSPTPACLATMSEFESRVLSMETRALDFLSKKVGAGDLSFDKIVAMVKPESKYVAAGTKYTAEMFIAASASGVSPSMFVDGKSIPVNAGIGIVEFTATPGNYDENNVAKKSFKAAIKVPLPGGADTTYTNIIEYFVTKPVISIQSKSVSALYLNCGNSLNVQVPALGSAYNPDFRAKGGDAIKGKEIGEVTIVPKSAKIVLSISSGGNFIGDREFNVRPIPSPEIKAFTDRGEINIKAGISSKTPKLYLKAEPDAGFAEFLPEDARFKVQECEITLVSGGLGRNTIKAQETINMGPIASSARKGDQIVIEIKKVLRRNFKGEIEDFTKFNKFIAIPLN